jgi:hypothetical protein
MASPYDSAIDMFNLPRYGTGGAPFPRREDPMTSARRRFLEGGQTAQPEQDFIAQRAQETEDPFGVMQEVENLRREREEEGFLSDIAALNPAQPDYRDSMMGLIQKNPRIAGSKSAMGLLDFQQNFLPKQQVDKFAVEAAGAGALVYQAYQRARSSGKDEVSAFADAMTEKARLEAISKPLKPGDDDRLTLTGPPREEFDALMAELASGAEPTDEDKMAFLPPGKSEYSKAEWDDAYFKAKAKKQQDSIGKLQNFRNTYGQMYQVPGVPRGGIQQAAVSPWEDRATVGNIPTVPQEAVPAPQPEVIPPPQQVIPVQTGTPTVPAMPASMAAARVSPADLKRVDPDAFKAMQQSRDQNKQSESSDARAQREAYFLQREAVKAKDIPLWESAKQQALKGMDEQDLRNLLTGGGMMSEGEMRTAILRATGKKYNEEAFVDASGEPVAWIEVFRSIRSDPRTKAIFSSQKTPSATPSAKSTPKVDRSSLWTNPSVGNK